MEPRQIADEARFIFETSQIENERLLLDAIAGRLNLFVRSDEQEQAWRWVEPILRAWAKDDARGGVLATYAAGTSGPRPA